jgi:hypothetical protein
MIRQAYYYIHDQKHNTMRFKNSLFTVLAFFAVGIGQVWAQNEVLKDISATQRLSEEIVVLFTRNLISPAFERMRAHWPIPANEIYHLEDKTIKYLNIVEQRYGKPIGYEKVRNETISDFAIRETYLIRYEFTALRLKFTYYKNNEGWIINGFKWDDDFTEEFF